GTVAGRFRVEGEGTDRESLVLTASGRLARAELFHGGLTDANVSLDIRGGTLRMTYDGRMSAIDPSVALDDSRFAASLTGSADVRATVRDLLLRTPEAADYDVDGTLVLARSVVRGIGIN